jgi:alanine racemase
MLANTWQKHGEWAIESVAQLRAWVEIDRSALANNVRAIKQKLDPKVAIMAVVKADAYGHGALDVARTVLSHGADRLAVATIAEGEELRQSGITAPILILGSIPAVPIAIDAIVKYQLEPTLVSIDRAEKIAVALTQKHLDRPLNVHLKLDTGMSRLGINWEHCLDLYRFVTSRSEFKLASIYSHFATADEEDRSIMELQSTRFEAAINQLVNRGESLPNLHLANSAGILQGSEFHYQIVRPGLILYGLYPAAHLRSTIDLHPVMQVRARVTQVKDIVKGTGVSYGHRYVADRDLKIAVVGIGYADGVPRRLSDRLKVAIRGKLVSQIGAITMDQIILDVSEIPDLEVGEVVTILGRDGNVSISADDWAQELGTISWEILCGFKHRLPRVTISSVDS